MTFQYGTYVFLMMSGLCCVYKKGYGLETPIVIPRKEKLSGYVWKMQLCGTRKKVPTARLETGWNPLFLVQVAPRDG